MSDRIIDRRYDLLLLFDVRDGNPNGDPDAGNMPRLDPETMRGLVTDGCLKRKVRNYIELVKRESEGGKPSKDQKDPGHRYEIYVKHRGILANEQRRAFKALGIEPSESQNLEARAWMCQNFFDIRAFGAVMTTGKSSEKDDDTAKKEKKKLWNCGQVRGPVQLTFARSVDRIVPAEASITRVALTNPGDTGRKSVEGEEGEEAGSGQMGRKSFVPYGLYIAHGFVSPALAADTKFTFSDLDLVFRALCEMFDHDHSAARGLMATRRLYIFQHTTALGEAPAHRLLERIERAIRRKAAVSTARSFDDYDVPTREEVEKSIPKGVTLREIAEGGYCTTPWE